MATRLETSFVRAIRAATIAAAVLGTGAALAQPIDPAASAPVAAAASSGPRAPVRRPPAARPPPPLGSDPANQPGLGQPVLPQLRIPLGRKPPPGVASAPRSAASSASSRN